MPAATSSATPEKGDQVSWSYGGSKPSGEVVEKKTDGELSIQSKKGNTIMRKGDPENPAVHMAREGNDVVKKQSELTVEEKADDKGEEEAETNGDGEDGEDEEVVTSTKRARESDDEEEEKEVKKSRGRPKGITKATPVKKTATGTGKRGRPAKPDSEKKVKAPSDGPKKGRGRPKKEEGAANPAKEKKEPKAKGTPKKAKASATTGVGSRTRSRK